MKQNRIMHRGRVAPVVFASLFALGLSACDQKPSAEKVGRTIDQNVEKAGDRLEQAAGTAHESADRMKESVSETARDAAKAVDDATVTAQVKAALIAEPGLEALKIDVDTRNGVVTLNGAAESSGARARAEAIASGISGVKLVRNELAVVAGS